MAELNHELRAKGIGSSEIAMLVIGDDGKPLSPFGGPHKLWRKKTGVELPEDEGRPWLERGHALEPYLLNRYAAKTGARLRRAPGTVQHKTLTVVVDSADALAWMPGDGKMPSRVVEAKAPLFLTLKDEWGEEGTEQVPRQYLVQGQWHMGAWGLPVCDYPVDGIGDIRIYTSKHDEELWLCLVEIAEKFWRDHVESGVPPPADATEETSQWLSRRLRQKDEDIIDAGEEAAKKLLAYRDLRLRVDADSADLEKLANEIKVIIGEHKGICLPGDPRSKITFASVKGRPTFHAVNYITELTKLIPPGVKIPEQADFTSVGESYRRFSPAGLLKGASK